MFNGVRLRPLPLKQGGSISTTSRLAGLKPAAALSPSWPFLSCRVSCAVSVSHDISALHGAGAMQRLCPFSGRFSSACRGTPFQLELAGELLPLAQGKPQFELSLRLPKRQGQRSPGSLVELKAHQIRRCIAPLIMSSVRGLRPLWAGFQPAPYGRLRRPALRAVSLRLAGGCGGPEI